MENQPAIESVQSDSLVTVSGSGEMDLKISKQFEEALSTAASSGLPVVVDLRSALYIDTAIIAALSRAGVAMLKDGRRLKVLARKDSHPLYALNIVGFSELMDIQVDEAGSGRDSPP